MNILTIDLEDWFHIINVPSAADISRWDNFENRVEVNSNRILDELGKKNIRATWFCLGWIAKKYPQLIRRISEKHDIACHSMYHKLLFEQGRDTAALDIRENISLLENITGKKVISYRAPGFSFTSQTKWLPEILFESGIFYDCSVFPAHHNHGGFPDYPFAIPGRIAFAGGAIRSFPMTTTTFLGKKIVFSGGGYFRVLPYNVIDTLMNKSEYNMTYFHPRDFDADQPVLEGLTWRRKFMSYTGLKKSFGKFRQLLNDHKFVSVEEAGALINWDKTPVIEISKL